MTFSVKEQLIIAIVVLATSSMQTHTLTSLVEATLLVPQQTSSHNNESIFNDRKPIATKENAGLNASATVSEPARALKRGKRYLNFLSTSRMFFRVNVKSNILPKPTVWAHGYGFRCNIPIENEKSVRPFRRDTYKTLENLINQSGFDGRACILKAFCAAHMLDNVDVNKGILFKLLQYIFTLSADDRRHFPYLNHENCRQILHSHCPLSFNNISPFTDDV